MPLLLLCGVKGEHHQVRSIIFSDEGSIGGKYSIVNNVANFYKKSDDIVSLMNSSICPEYCIVYVILQTPEITTNLRKL